MYLYRWKILRSTNPETLKVWLFICSTANQRATQNNYRTLGFQDLYFLNFFTCTRNNITGDTLKCQVKWMVSRNETFPSRDSRLVSKKCGSLQRVRNREGNLASFSKGPSSNISTSTITRILPHWQMEQIQIDRSTPYYRPRVLKREDKRQMMS